MKIIIIIIINHNNNDNNYHNNNKKIVNDCSKKNYQDATKTGNFFKRKRQCYHTSSGEKLIKKRKYYTRCDVIQFIAN